MTGFAPLTGGFLVLLSRMQQVLNPEANPVRYDSGCAGKQHWPSEDAAEQSLQLFRTRRVRHFKQGRQATRDFAEMVPYHCEFCDGWHVGH
jgi:hypothetical protein